MKRQAFSQQSYRPSQPKRCYKNYGARLHAQKKILCYSQEKHHVCGVKKKQTVSNVLEL